MITVTGNVELTPKQLAEEFWNMDCEQQAEFFNILGEIIKDSGGRGIMQLDYIFLSKKLNDSGIWLLNKLDYEEENYYTK